MYRKIGLIFLIACIVPSLVDAQTVWWGDGPGGYRDGYYTHPPCNNDGTNGKRLCEMCWGPDGIAARQAVVRQKQVTVPQQTEMVAMQEAYTVKVCRNGVCRYETRYRTVMRPRPVQAATKAVAGAMRRVAYTVSVPVVTRVKRCNGRQCWYENVTTMRTETRYRMEPVEPQASITQPATFVSTEAAQAPTPYEAVAAMIRLIGPTAGDVVYDLGCGDGRVLVAASVCGAKSVGIEIDKQQAEQAREVASVFGVSDKVRVYDGDILDYDLSNCRLVTMYLYPELMDQVAAKLPSGCKVWSYMHGLPGAKRHDVGEFTFYEWVKS